MTQPCSVISVPFTKMNKSTLQLMRRIACRFLLATSLLAVSAQAKIITVNTENNSDFGAGKTNLVRAINALADGDTIQFNIPGSGVHYLQTPDGGYPLITRNSVILDGYSQPGSVPNSNPIHAPNNAQIKIVLTSTNGNGTAIVSQALAFTGYGGFAHAGFNNNDYAVLAFFRGTNNWVRGFAIQSASDGQVAGTPGPLFGIAFMADEPGLQPYPNANGGNWHISGCWIGLDPATGQPALTPDGNLASPRHGIDTERNRNGGTITNCNYPQPGTLGVAAGSANPRAEFNVIISGWAANLVGPNLRFSGNFFNVLPDGMHNYDVAYMPNAVTQMGDAFLEFGRQPDNITIGTDGDGVNDEDEGNVFGGTSAYPFNPPARSSYYYFDFYYGPSPSTPLQGTNITVAGNYFGVAVDGSTRFTNACVFMHSMNGAGGTARVGSDFDGVSDRLEGNLLCNNYPFETQFPQPGPGSMYLPGTTFDGNGAASFGGNPTGARLSFRGNRTIGNDLLPYKWADGTGNGTRGTAFTNYSAPYMITTAGVIPTLSSASSTGEIIGTCAAPNGIYTNVFIDVYELDKEGWENGKLFAMPELSDYTTFTNGFPQGKELLGTFVDNGPLDRDPAVGKFRLNAASLGIAAGKEITVTANYSADPAGTRNGRAFTSNFSDPVSLRASLRITSVERSGSNVIINWTGGAGPFSLQKKSTVTGTWTTVQTGLNGSSTSYPDSGTSAFYRLSGN